MIRERIVPKIMKLTHRDLRVLRLVAKGKKNAEIGEELNLGEKTIEHMLGNTDLNRSIYAKIGATQRWEAISWWWRKYGDPDKFEDFLSSNISLPTVSHTSNVFGEQNQPLNVEMIAMSSNDLLDILYENLKNIRQVKREGNPELAIQHAKQLSKHLDEMIKNPVYKKSWNELHRLRGHVLVETVWAYNVILKPKEVLEVTSPLIKQVQGVAKDCGDMNLIGLADICWGDANYVARNYRRSTSYLYEGLKIVADLDIQQKALRALALNYAYLNDVERFQKVEKEVRNLIDQGLYSELDKVCATLEAIGRGQGIFGMDKSFDTFSEVEDIYTQINEKDKAPLRRIQLARSRVRTLQHLESNVDKGLLEEIGKQGIFLAQEYGYHRHAQRIEQLLSESLN